MKKKAIRVAVTGASGHIGYSILFRIATGEMLGHDQPIILQLLEIESAMSALNGVIMELEDCAFPLLNKISASADPKIAFQDADIAILVGSKPRTKGMERKELLEANGLIFIQQGRALAEVANNNVRVLVVGNPANTNALITLKNAVGLNPKNITAMLRLDHNRAYAKLSHKLTVLPNELSQIIVWGNHSLTQYPDLSHAMINNNKVSPLLTTQWINDDFIPSIQQRGAKIIEARGLSSAASAANAAIDHIHDWVLGSNDQWVSMGVISDGSYGIPEGVIYGFPCICKNGDYHIVQELTIDESSRERMMCSYQELLIERETIKHLLN